MAEYKQLVVCHSWVNGNKSSIYDKKKYNQNTISSSIVRFRDEIFDKHKPREKNKRRRKKKIKDENPSSIYTNVINQLEMVESCSRVTISSQQLKAFDHFGK